MYVEFEARFREAFAHAANAFVVDARLPKAKVCNMPMPKVQQMPREHVSGEPVVDAHARYRQRFRVAQQDDGLVEIEHPARFVVGQTRTHDQAVHALRSASMSGRSRAWFSSMSTSSSV